MIKQIKLVGFKSFLYRTLNLNRLTLLTGLNSSGKSSVIQALLMLEKVYNREKSILLEGHGAIKEIENTYSKNDIELEVINKTDKVFSVQISRLNSTHSVTNNDNFEFPEILYVSADRFGSRTSIPIYNDSSKRNRIGQNGENLLQFIDEYANEKLDERLKHEKSEGLTVEYNIRGWLSVISPNVEFKYKIDKTSDSSYSTFNEHRATNVGFGLSYTLPVIATLLIATLIPNSLVIIENPEAHLHPKGQTEIAKLISLCVQVGAQVIIETHSDHLFDGVRIAAKTIENFSDDVQIHWFELNEQRNTEVYSPNLSKDGRINEWPKGFFDQFEINASELL